MVPSFISHEVHRTKIRTALLTSGSSEIRSIPKTEVPKFSKWDEQLADKIIIHLLLDTLF